MELVPLALEHEAFFHAVMCVSASHMTIESRELNPQYVEIYHRGVTFRLLANLLSQQNHATSDSTVATILMMSGFEVLFGITDEHEAHMRGLDRIIVSRGGVDSLGYKGFLKMMITWCVRQETYKYGLTRNRAFHFRAHQKKVNQQLASRSESESGLHLPNEDSLLAEQHFTDDEESLLPTGFREALRQDLIDNTFRKIIQMLSSLTVIINNPPASTAGNMIIISENRMKVEELLDLQYNSFSTAPKGNVQECCCIALLLHDHTALRMMPRGAAILVKLSSELHVKLLRIPLDTQVWGTGRHLLLWVLFIGYAASPDLLIKSWFASHIQKVISSSRWIEQANDLTTVLKTFLWSDNRHIQGVEELWSTIIESSTRDY